MLIYVTAMKQVFMPKGNDLTFLFALLCADDTTHVKKNTKNKLKNSKH